MIADGNNATGVCAPAADDDNETPDDATRRRETRRHANARPRCSKCGRFDMGPGGAGFGDGEWYCETCAVRLDLERGDGSAR